MTEISAGLLMYAIKEDKIKVFLVHPGGPYFTKKDDGYWGIPKGLTEKNEEYLSAAIREFTEETGITPHGDYLPLGSIKQKNGKIVHAWAFQTDNDDPVELKSNTFEMEWPPHSGRKQHFPEVDRGQFFTIEEAKKKMVEAQFQFVEKIEQMFKSK